MRHHALAVLLLLLWHGTAAGPPAMAAEGGSRAGKLLVADPDLGDPNFSHTVVLVLQDDAAGSLGLVLNRPLGKAPAKELLAKLGLKLEGPDRQLLIFQGGPVQPEMGFVLHDSSYKRPDTVTVGPGIAVTADSAVLKDIAEGKGPREALPLLGYAGWGPGQLDSEINEGTWAIIDADPKLIFATPPDRQWQEAWRRRGIEL